MIQEPPSGLADDDGWDRALGDGSAIPRTRLCDKVAFSHGDVIDTRRNGRGISYYSLDSCYSRDCGKKSV